MGHVHSKKEEWPNATHREVDNPECKQQGPWPQGVCSVGKTPGTLC